MKKFISVCIFIGIVFNSSFISYAASYTSVPQTESENVGVSFTKRESDVISVDITWGNMIYKYKSKVEWDSGSRTYKPVEGDTGEWVLADPSNNNENAVIRVTNNCDKSIYVDYNYTKKSNTGIPSKVNGVFYANSDFTGLNFETTSNRYVPSLAEPGTPDDGNIDDFYIKLTGALTSLSADVVDNGITLGEVTVSLSSEQGGPGSND